MCPDETQIKMRFGEISFLVFGLYKSVVEEIRAYLMYDSLPLVSNTLHNLTGLLCNTP